VRQISKRTTTARLHCRPHPQLGEMQFFSVLVDGGCRLSAAIAFGVIEVQSADGMLAEDALECNAAVQRFGGVIAHNSL